MPDNGHTEAGEGELTAAEQASLEVIRFIKTHQETGELGGDENTAFYLRDHEQDLRKNHTPSTISEVIKAVIDDPAEQGKLFADFAEYYSSDTELESSHQDAMVMALS